MNLTEGLLLIILLSVDVVTLYKYVIMVAMSKNVPMMEKIMRHLTYLVVIGSVSYLLWQVTW